MKRALTLAVEIAKAMLLDVTLRTQDTWDPPFLILLSRKKLSSLRGPQPIIP